MDSFAGERLHIAELKSMLVLELVAAQAERKIAFVFMLSFSPQQVMEIHPTRK